MSVEAGVLDQVTQQFMLAFRHDAGLLQHTAKSLFYYLTTIQLTFAAIWMALAGEAMDRMLVRFVQMVFSFGFFYACIEQGVHWMPAIINGFIQIGQQAGIKSIDPSSILDQGLSIAGSVIHAGFNTGLFSHPVIALLSAVVCIAIVVIYGLLVAELAIILVKSYFVVSVSSLFFAFAGSDVTRPMTMNYFRTVIGLGLQLMTLYFLMGVGQTIGNGWVVIIEQAAQQHSLTPMLAILACVIVYYMIVKNIPPFIAALSGIGGFRNYGDAAVATAISAGVSGAGTLSSVASGAGKVVQGGGQLFQVGAHAWQAGAHGAAMSAGGFGAKAMNLVTASTAAVSKAAVHTAKDAVMNKNTELTTGQKMNHHMENYVKGLKGRSNG